MCKKTPLILIFILVLLTGCWDKVEINERAHISAIGIDRYTSSSEAYEADNQGSSSRHEDKRNQFKFIFAFPKHSLQETEDIIVATIGDTLYGVSKILADRTNKEMFLGHLRTVILSKSVTEDEHLFRQILDGIETNELLSRRVILAMTEDDVADIINITPSMEPRIGQFISEIFNRKDRTPRAPEGSIGNILKDLYESKNAVIPKITAGKNDVKVAGAGVISNYKFKGWLNEVQTAHLMMIKGEAKSAGGISIVYKDTIVPIDIKVKKSKMKLIEDGKNIKILINIDAEGDIKQTYFGSDYDLLEAKTIREIEDVFNKYMGDRLKETVHVIQKDFRADILGIDRFIRQRHYKLWKEVEQEWPEIFPNIEIDVKINIDIRRVGLVR